MLAVEVVTHKVATTPHLKTCCIADVHAVDRSVFVYCDWGGFEVRASLWVGVAKW